MKTRTKALLLSLCAVLLVVTTVFATLAYLQASTQTLTNTFTIGKVAITLTETGADGQTLNATEQAASRTYADVVPGQSYAKDPTITVLKDSKNSYVFVEITDDTKDFVEWDIADGWTQLQEGVYYRDYSAATEDVPYQVLDGNQVTIAKNAANNQTMGALTFKAYAIQKADDIDGAAAAWALLNA